jgi:hypothetical protein
MQHSEISLIAASLAVQKSFWLVDFKPSAEKDMAPRSEVNRTKVVIPSSGEHTNGQIPRMSKKVVGHSGLRRSMRMDQNPDLEFRSHL